MPRFTVRIPEVHTVTLSVEAPDEKTARSIVNQMIADNDLPKSEWSYIFDEGDWEVNVEGWE